MTVVIFGAPDSRNANVAAVGIGRRNAYCYACGHIPSVDWPSLLELLCRSVVQTDVGGEVSQSFMLTRWQAEVEANRCLAALVHFA